MIERSLCNRSSSKIIGVESLCQESSGYWMTGITGAFTFWKLGDVNDPAGAAGNPSDVLVFVSEIAATDELQALIEAGGEA